MTQFIRTPDENFANLSNFDYSPQYHAWQDLRMHYVDVGPADGPVMLLLHGMPTWSYLYRDIIPALVSAGFRCIAPDHIGFGRSDKPTDIHWYTIARHVEILTSLITALDLRRVTLVCQDWGGPIGLAQAVMMPERFDRLIIMNTWLHHPEYEYTDGIRNWNRNWHDGGIFCRDRPDIALLMVFSARLAGPDVDLSGADARSSTAVHGSRRARSTTVSPRRFAICPTTPITACADFRCRSRSTATTTATVPRRLTTTACCSRGTSPSISFGGAPTTCSLKRGAGNGRAG